MDTRHIELWPNRLGVNVGESEVWKTRLDGTWGVRCIHHDMPHKWLHIDPREYLFLSEADAVDLCCQHGTLIE